MKRNRLNTMNRRGDIPITFLVVGVVLVCCIAVFSFLSTTIKATNSLVGVRLLERLNSQIEEKISNNEEPAGLYINKKIIKGFLFWEEEIVLFSAEYKNQGS